MEGLAQGANDLVPDLERGLGMGDPGQQHQELVAADPTDTV